MKHLHRILLFAMGLACCMSFSLVSQEPETVRVIGTVKHWQTGADMEGVQVIVAEEGRGNEAAVTGADGTFGIDVPVGQEITLRFQKSGFKRAVFRYAFPKQRRAHRMEVTLAKGAAASEAVLLQ
jgi:hypothetical protein